MMPKKSDNFSNFDRERERGKGQREGSTNETII